MRLLDTKVYRRDTFRPVDSPLHHKENITAKVAMSVPCHTGNDQILAVFFVGFIKLVWRWRAFK